jgi:hypothetical protein
MNHDLKRNLLTLLEMFPPPVGDSLYHFLQRVGGRFDFDKVVRSQASTYDKLISTLRSLDFELQGSEVFEIGTGWLPVVPYHMIFSGKCRSVISYDKVCHFSPRRALELQRFFEIAYSIPRSSFEWKDAYSVPREFTYYPREDVTVKLANGKTADLVFTRFVLEHVPEREIVGLHHRLHQILRPDGLIVHFISPSDHRAYEDSTLSLVDFLQYSAEEWQEKQTRFDFHNRLRLPQYIRLFQDSGFRIRHTEYKCAIENPDERGKFLKLNLHPDFAQMTPEEVTAGSIVVVLAQDRSQGGSAEGIT